MKSNEIQRVVLLRKNLQEIYSDSELTLPHDATSWIALGHFDEIYTYSLPSTPSQFFLDDIKKDKQRLTKLNDDKMYLHPLYLVGNRVPLYTYNGIKENEFHFLAIVRIHFASTCNHFQDYIDLCENIKSHLQNSKNANIYCSTYHATEFSDMVLDLRSHDFRAIQEFVLITLRNNRLIGKMYTYFGVNKQFMYSSEVCSKNDSIDMISVRFPCGAPKEQIILMRKHLGQGSNEVKNMYSINGIDDTFIICKNIPTNNLINAYRYFIADQKKPENIKSTTRIGFYIDAPLLCPPNSDIVCLCEKLIDLRDKMSHALDNCEIIPRRWFHMIFESVNTLVRMSKSSVMDEIVYLLAPSLEAFIENIILATPDVINRHVKSYNGFAENYVFLLEHMMRLEGQLSQNPEYRPIICDVPIFVLEYTLAFLSKTVYLLQHGDDATCGQVEKFECLLVPCSCPEIAVKELFSAENGKRGVLELLIPEQSLYLPDAVLRPLCHEVAHNVGEKYRCRLVRKKYYCRAIATLIANELLNSRNTQKVVHMLMQKFLAPLSDNENPTIITMAKEIRKVYFPLVHTTDSQENRSIVDMGNFIHTYLTELKDPDPIHYLDRFQLEKICNYIDRRWLDIDTLFREIYADICLLKILDLPVQEYIDSLLNVEWHVKDGAIAIDYDVFAVRIFVSLKSVGKEIQTCGTTDVAKRVYSIICNIEKEICDRTDGQFKLPFSTNTIVDMIKYGKHCFSEMDRDLQSAEREIKEVKDMYRALASVVDYPGYEYIVKAIDAYRKTVIQSTKAGID